MNKVFHNKLDNFLVIYLDDILVFSYTIEKHEAHLLWVFNKLKKTLFKSQNENVLFWCIKIGILGTYGNTIWFYNKPRKKLKLSININHPKISKNLKYLLVYITTILSFYHCMHTLQYHFAIYYE